jgi:ATP-dependent DNA ligase
LIDANPTLLGLIGPCWKSGRSDQAPEPAPARVVPGGRNAAELCMLPTDIEAAALDTIQAGTKRIVQLKADGIRALYMDGRIISREGTPLNCALHGQPGLTRLESALGCNWMIDGEYVEANGFNATLSALRAGIGQGVFWVFDAIPMDDWMRGACYTPAYPRLTTLRAQIAQSDSPFVGMLDFKMLSAGDTRAHAEMLWGRGYEGVVTKAPDSPYLRQRSNHWRRCKQVFTADCQVMDVLRKNGVIKGIMVRGPDGLGDIRVSAGLDTADAVLLGAFHEAAANVDDPPRATVRIRYELTAGVKRTVRGAAYIRLVEGNR